MTGLPSPYPYQGPAGGWFLVWVWYGHSLPCLRARGRGDPARACETWSPRPGWPGPRRGPRPSVQGTGRGRHYTTPYNPCLGRMPAPLLSWGAGGGSGTLGFRVRTDPTVGRVCRVPYTGMGWDPSSGEGEDSLPGEAESTPIPGYPADRILPLRDRYLRTPPKRPCLGSSTKGSERVPSGLVSGGEWAQLGDLRERPSEPVPEPVGRSRGTVRPQTQRSGTSPEPRGRSRAAKRR